MTLNDNVVDAFPIVIVGHVDHGKSTLIGRLLNDTGALPDGKAEELHQMSKRRGVATEWSFALDSMQLERDQAITVDSTQIWFSSSTRRYVIIDAPGHGEFLRNMITGAAQAEAAIIVVDAAQGLTEQTLRHAYLLHLLGITQVIVAINKMDKAGFEESVYARLGAEIKAHLDPLGLAIIHAIPVTARDGDNLATRSARMSWWKGPTLLDALNSLSRRETKSGKLFRLAVQDVYREDEQRIIVGRIESGRVKVGDKVQFWPTGRTARIKAFLGWNATTPILSAASPQSVALIVDDEVFVERGHVVAAFDQPPCVSKAIRARVFWLGQSDLVLGREVKLRIGTAVMAVTVSAIHRVLDVDKLLFHAGAVARTNDIVEVTLTASAQLVFDIFQDHASLGRGVLIDGYDVVAGCVIDEEISATAATQHSHPGAVMWMTGLSGAGKSTLAQGLRKQLIDSGARVIVLDGDKLRGGLNVDLGFSSADRSENLRRTAEVAKLFMAEGYIVIAALISPSAADRSKAREIIGAGYHEVFVNADLAVCEARDVKGLYAKARGGALNQFTGVSAVWEPPTSPDLELKTAVNSYEASLQELTTYVETKILTERNRRSYTVS